MSTRTVTVTRGCRFPESRGDFTPIPYRGDGAAQNDLLAGQIHVMFNDIGTALPLVQSGKIRPLGIADKVRSPALPNVPTMAEAGYPHFEAISWYAVVARAGTPQAIVDLCCHGRWAPS